MDPAHSRMIKNELVNKDTDVVPEQALLIVLDINSYLCMSKIDKDTKHTRNIYKKQHLVRNG